jgi:hypothetical protein
VLEVEPKKEVVPIKVDLSKDDDEEPVKNEKAFQIDSDAQKYDYRSIRLNAHFHSRKISTDRKCSENIIVKS